MIDWVRNRLASSTWAAASRLVVPWVRNRLVRAMPLWRVGAVRRAVSRGGPQGLEPAPAHRVAGQAEHLVAGGDELAGEGDADGAAGAGEQDPHDFLPRRWSAMATTATRVSSPSDGTSLA